MVFSDHVFLVVNCSSSTNYFHAAAAHTGRKTAGLVRSITLLSLTLSSELILLTAISDQYPMYGFFRRTVPTNNSFSQLSSLEIFFYADKIRTGNSVRINSEP